MDESDEAISQMTPAALVFLFNPSAPHGLSLDLRIDSRSRFQHREHVHIPIPCAGLCCRFFQLSGHVAKFETQEFEDANKQIGNQDEKNYGNENHHNRSHKAELVALWRHCGGLQETDLSRPLVTVFVTSA